MDFENTIFHPHWYFDLLEYQRRVVLLSKIRTLIITVIPYIFINVITLTLLNKI